MRYELTDHEWAAIKPMLPNKPRSIRAIGGEVIDHIRAAPEIEPTADDHQEPSPSPTRFNFDPRQLSSRS